jgi:hypothetical protein
MSLDNNPDILLPGQQFQMNYGFMRGSDFVNKKETGHIITSINGYHNYFLIIDKRS